MISAGEYQQGTIVDTFLTELRRTRVVMTKLFSGALVDVVSGILGAIVTATTASLWYAAKDVPLDLKSAVVLRSFVEIVLSALVTTARRDVTV